MRDSAQLINLRVQSQNPVMSQEVKIVNTVLVHFARKLPSEQKSSLLRLMPVLSSSKIILFIPTKEIDVTNICPTGPDQIDISSPSSISSTSFFFPLFISFKISTSFQTTLRPCPVRLSLIIKNFQIFLDSKIFNPSQPNFTFS